MSNNIGPGSGHGVFKCKCGEVLEKCDCEAHQVLEYQIADFCQKCKPLPDIAKYLVATVAGLMELPQDVLESELAKQEPWRRQILTDLVEARKMMLLVELVNETQAVRRQIQELRKWLINNLEK